MDTVAGPTQAYGLDATVQRHGDVLIGGSPLALFRLTPAGSRLIDRIASGAPVAGSPLIDRLVDAGVLHPRPAPDASPFTVADVTVVVPTLGPPAHLPDGEVLLVDDGSDPPVPGAAIRLDHNQGPAAARNAGLASVTTPLVAFVDGDVDTGAGDAWLEPLLAHFADPRVALVAPRVVTPGAGYEGDHSPLDLGPQPARIRAGTRVSYVPAAAIVCRTDVVREVGGFDATLRVGEDVDLVWRLDAAGWRCRYEPSVVVHHDPRPTWRGWLRQRVTYGRSAAPLAERHPGALAPLRMSGWSVATWALPAIGRPLAGAAVGFASAAALVKKLPHVPPRVAFTLAARGNLFAGTQLAQAVRRAWWPILAVAAFRSRSARRVLLASALAARHPLRVADDVAYSVGVWSGVIEARTIGPLVPHLAPWPGRRT